MAAPPEHNPLFHPLHAGLLPEALRSLAGRVYLSVAHRSQHANREDVFEQFAQRIAAHPSER